MNRIRPPANLIVLNHKTRFCGPSCTKDSILQDYSSQDLLDAGDELKWASAEKAGIPSPEWAFCPSLDFVRSVPVG